MNKDSDRLKKIRLKLGLTQKELAEKLGTHQQIIAMIENNKRECSKEIIRQLLNIYGLNFYDFNDDKIYKTELNELERELKQLNDLMNQPSLMIDEKGNFEKIDITSSVYYQIGRVLFAYEHYINAR